MQYGFIKVAAASPTVRVADCKFNLSEHIELARLASEKGVKILVFPELSLTSSTCGDLFFSSTLQDGAIDALTEYVNETKKMDIVSVVGLPLRVHGMLYNAAAVVNGGEILRFITKTNLTNAETRYFSTIGEETDCLIHGDNFVSVGTDFALACESMPDLRLGVEIGEDLFAPCPPSAKLSAYGATVIANPAANCETVGAEEYRRLMVTSQSKRSHLGYIMSNAGYGESSTDHTFASHAIICENGNILAETKPFDIAIDDENDKRLTISEIDVSMLTAERIKSGFRLDGRMYGMFDLKLEQTALTRTYDTSPFIPKNEGYARAEKILSIQATALARRIVAAYASKCIIGISGGLDSTLAMLATAKALDILKRPRTDIIGITMPGFGTTKRTKGNAEILCEELGVTFKTISIAESVMIHFKDIGHNPDEHNVVYENGQARERTQVLMDIANAENGMVIGTGDMSELALGWATYNGDHMSMYGMNASIPKTLVRHLVEYCAVDADKNGNERLAKTLWDILDTPVSPELLPADGNKILQKTEDIVGPYEIHDFYLYYMLRYGFSPEKLYHLACYALGDTFSKEALIKWLEVFIRRFFTQQYKRSCVPDGPCVGTVGLSPRCALKMPSDAAYAVWMAEIEKIKSSL